MDSDPNTRLIKFCKKVERPIVQIKYEMRLAPRLRIGIRQDRSIRIPITPQAMSAKRNATGKLTPA